METMHEPLQQNASRPSATPGSGIDHIDREKKIRAPTIAHLLRAARRIVEEMVWENGMVWHPTEMLRQLSSSELAKRVFPDAGTPAAGACAKAIRSYTGKAFTEDGARSWLAEKIGERLDRYVIRARSKAHEVHLVVTQNEVEVCLGRPDTTRKAVGPAPWSPQV